MVETQPLIIFGAGGMGREIAGMVRSIPGWQVKGFLDDRIKKGSFVDGIPVLGGGSAIEGLDRPLNLVLAVGDPSVKKRIHERLSSKDIHFPSLVHPSAILQTPESIRVGHGVIITAGCVLTTAIEIGDHVLLNLRVTVGHDTHIGAFTSVMPGVNIAGLVKIGEEVLIGSGANIINSVEIGSRTRVGAGAVVIQNLPPGVTAVGVPARYRESQD